MRMALVRSTIAIMAAAAAPAMAATPGGAKLFQDHCQVCHQAEGVGVAGQFPRLAGRAPALASKPEGRIFLSQVVLNGMSGAITVDGQMVIGVMPPFRGLGDTELAGILSYVSGLGAKAKPTAFRPGEVATARAAGVISPGAMAAARKNLPPGVVGP